MGATMQQNQAHSIDEELDELDKQLGQLRVEYDQYFRGALKREPQVRLGKVQRLIQRFVAKPPKNSGQRFRFNQLNAKFQSFRQRWGRTLRDIEAGRYQPHRFRAALHTEESDNEATPSPVASTKPAAAAKSSAIERLYAALTNARRKTGESVADLSREKLAHLVRQQTDAIRQQKPSAKIRFRVVIEDNRAKLKASLRD